MNPAFTPLLSVAVDLTRWDLLRLSYFALPRNTVFRSALIGIGAFVVATLVHRRGFPSVTKEFVVILFTALLFMSGAAVFILLLNSVAVLLASNAVRGVLGRHDYSVRDNGLLEVTAANETLIKWGGAMSLYRRASFLCIQVSPTLYHVMPRRSFASDAEFAEFWRAIQPLKSVQSS